MTYTEQATAPLASVDAVLAQADADAAKAATDLASAQAKLGVANQKVLDLTAANDLLTTRLAQANAEIARLNAIINPPPPVPVAKTLIGSSTGAVGDFEAFAARCGGLEVQRSFSPPGKMPTSIAATEAASGIGKRRIAHSFKGRVADINASCQSLIDGKDDAWISAFLASKTPTQALDVIWRHEPDEELPDPTTWSLAQHKFRTLVNAANAAGRAKAGWVDIKFGANLMSWSTNKVPGRIANLYPGDNVWDFISWDGYSKTAPYNTPAAIFDTCLAWNKAHGNLPFAIGEFGADGTPTTDRSAWIKAVCDYAKANKAWWANYWNASTADGNYVLSPADEKVLGAQS